MAQLDATFQLTESGRKVMETIARCDRVDERDHDSPFAEQTVGGHVIRLLVGDWGDDSSILEIHIDDTNVDNIDVFPYTATYQVGADSITINII